MQREDDDVTVPQISLRLFRLACISLALFFTARCLPSRAQAHSPQVAIDSGTLEGVNFGALSHAAAFLGIPYAAQPVGDLRWKPPQPPPAWTGMWKALTYAPACPQNPSPWLPEMLGRQQMRTDEGCLYLNVWTPHLSQAAKLPVMVWIHGGGNVEGSAEWPPLGETLASKGVVVVSINYRLGVFGFFAWPALSAESPRHVSGNYGQMDQVAALQWVQRNIRRFGGDPNEVTVFGASSGALDICNLMASPRAAGTFARAILQSGVCVDSIFPPLHEAEENDNLLATDLGVQAGPHSLAELRALPAERILQAASRDPHLDLEPVVDGWFLTQQPAATFAQQKQARVPVIVGSNANEVSIFASPIVGGKSYRPKTVAEYRRWLQSVFKSNADAVFAAYPAARDQDVLAAFQTMDTDFDFGFGARLLAVDTTRAGQNAFLYHFTYIGAGKFAALGAFHSEESMFLSRKYWTSWATQPGERKLSDTIVAYWIQFAKAGNPNVSGLPTWPPYSASGDLCQELGRRIGPEPVPRARRFPILQRVLDSRLKASAVAP
ncbi:MAG: carboxylesterase/lipase family protein [Acidobacteriaceae bacterium]